MAEEIVDQIRDVFEGQIDFEGQKLVELLATALLVISGFLSFIVGYALQDIKMAVYVGLAGTAVTFLVVVPPWPFYKKKPVKWLPAGTAYEYSTKQTIQ